MVDGVGIVDEDSQPAELAALVNQVFVGGAREGGHDATPAQEHAKSAQGRQRLVRRRRDWRNEGTVHRKSYHGATCKIGSLSAKMHYVVQFSRILHYMLTY